MEGYYGTCIVAFAYDFNLSDGFSFGILLDVDLALTVDFSDQKVGKGVDAGYADSVQTSGHLVAVLVELAAGMQDGQNDLESGAVLLGMHSGRDASSVVLYCY